MSTTDPVEEFDSSPLNGENPEEVHAPEIHLTHLTGMYQDWFLDYASYVILERAVPHVYDGLKPVQRRILHAMKELDDGRYNKVANIIGHTMKYHPHGDASIGDALVQLGQKDLLIDMQGNWGNIYTGDSAAAPRYIEARLSKFALEVVFNPKTTFWKSSYDGRNKEPITLPVKFPLLLAQGVEGIAVGLASKILPHNFNELIDACIATLKNEPFELFPDFITGGQIDVSKYNDGLRGGKVRVRARIEKLDKKTLVITDIPFGENTTTLIESIIQANDKEKIKVKKIDDNTASVVEILIHLPPGVSSDKTIDALYAFTKCEVSISPNSCVIEEDKPRFMGVSDMLQASVYNTVELLKQELLIRKRELEEQWHYMSLERWFIEKRIYKDKAYENAMTNDEAVAFIGEKASLTLKNLKREITNDDLLKLLEIKMKRIIRYNAEKADEEMHAIEGQIQEVVYNLEHLTVYAINYYTHIKAKYGKGRERKTEIRNFDTIDTSNVAVANEKLYVERKEGFAGTGLKKEEFVCECSDIDDIIVFRRDGKYIISKVSEKAFFGKDIIHIDVFKRNDTRTIYNVVYRDGRFGSYFIKRFAVTGINRDKEYDVTKGEAGSKIVYFTANPNGEAEVIKVNLKPKPKLRKLVFEADFKDIAIKGRSSMGNIISKNDIFKITLKEEGVSTLGGRKIWFDDEVLRLNADGRGKYLGEFEGDDKILCVSKKGSYYLSNFDLSNHYDESMIVVEKYDASKVWSAIYFDAAQGFYYLKRFVFDETSKETSFLPEDEGSRLVMLNDDMFPQVSLTFTGKHAERPGEIIDAEEFIAVKGIKAKGKRLSTFEIEKAAFTEPLQKEFPDNGDDETEEADSSGEENDIDSNEVTVEQAITDQEPERPTVTVKTSKIKAEIIDKQSPPVDPKQMSLDFE
ncbi:MAG TPA: DNA gyrase/topoisomerase IV subunit A [Bacteroidales bacterium]|nr:DNA gyrase/topoisomerase IV subunit A [Bacteroidales bacterium]